ncbi:acyl transferase [Cryomorphaceae bacterium 1068]|nr:acyl transferase [Cryomorphaceae bacterium 1068]
MTAPSVEKIFEINSEQAFNERCLEVFQFQARENAVYRQYMALLGVNAEEVNRVEDIPFLPIELFKSHKITSGESDGEALIFSSSGTTGTATSKHYVYRPETYEQSFLQAFQQFYGSPSEYRILALLPSYLERTGSSLIYMVDRLIRDSQHADSGFFLADFDRLRAILATESERKTLLIGVSFGLLDFIEEEGTALQNTIVMETGGMKGRRKEMTREELHAELKAGFSVDTIHSEYGMTELLSQAYSKGNGIFNCPPWMKVLVRDTNDPLTILPAGSSGGVNVIDLANLYSCSFIATSDLGKTHPDGSFEILGRFDYSDLRGCNLMVAMD